MKIANRLIVVSSLLIAAGCAHHDRQTNTGYSSTTYGAAGTSGTGAYSSTDRYSSSDRSSSTQSGRYSSPSDTTSGTTGSFNSQSQSSTSFAGQGDSGLTTQVQQSLKSDPSLSNFSSGIMVNAQNGTVTLTGTVPSEQDKQKVESMVKNTSGVVTVNNQLQVSLRPTSERPDQNSRIYHDSKDQGSTTTPGSTFDSSKSSSDTSKTDTSATGTAGTSVTGTAGTSTTDQTRAGISSSTSSTPDQSAAATSSKSDLTASGTSSIGGTSSTDSSKTGISGTSSTPGTSSTDVSGTAGQSSTPSTPTSDRPSTRVYTGQQDTSSSTSSGDTAAAGSLSFNVQGTTEADKSIGRQVMQELRSDPTLGAMLSQIKINVESGKVTLKGNVKSEEQKKNAESVAQKVTGVSTIDNQLKVSADASSTTGTESK